MHDQYEVLSTLGTGSYGQVVLARDRRSSRLYAIKSIDKSRRNRDEFVIHAKLMVHPHIVRLERILYDSDTTAHMVLEYAPEGDLFKVITERNPYYSNHTLIQRVFLQLIDALRFCHQRGVYHRDLKPENILVFESGYTLKIADFGLATLDSVTNELECGSTLYFSPESQEAHTPFPSSHTYATAPNDVWALGIILINLAARRNPWHRACLDDETFKAYLADRDHIYRVLPISRQLHEILKRVLCIDPTRRIGLDELETLIRQCEFFTRTADVEDREKLTDGHVLSLDPLSFSHATALKLQDIFPPTPPQTPSNDGRSTWLA
ncbi:kinase-like domain-containing protein [Dichotomocladium elegans]|nr:kinase-like domain-containing protein [Dichotomocladium elegans]